MPKSPQATPLPSDPAASPSPVAVCVLMLVILSGALALRVWRIDFGLPDFYHADEPSKLGVLMRLLADQPADYFRHPGLMLNLMALWNRAAIAMGGSGEWLDVALRSRLLSALVGALTVIPAYGIASSLYGRRAGLIAAAALAAVPDHVTHSRYHKEDIYLTLAIALALWGLVRWLQSRPAPAPGQKRSAGRPGWLALAIVGAGLALGTKYVGVFAVLFVIAALAIYHPRPKAAIAITVVAALAILIASAPQMLTESDALRRDFAEEYRGGVDGDNTPSLNVYQWPDIGTYFMIHGYCPGMDWPLALVSLWGFALAWRERRRRPEGFWLALFFVAWYVLMEITPRKRATDSERYILPMIALGTVWIGAMAAHWRPRRFFKLRLPAKFWPAMTPLLILIPLAHSVLVARAIEPDTRKVSALTMPDLPPDFIIAYVNKSDLRAVNSILPEGDWRRFTFILKHEEDQTVYASARALYYSEYATARYDNFKFRSRRQLKTLNKTRAEFPQAVYISAPWYARSGFHNPDLEIRFLDPDYARRYAENIQRDFPSVNARVETAP